MGNKSAMIRRVLAEYDGLRTTALREAAQRREAIYARLPQLAELDQRLRQSGLAAAKLALSDPATAVAGAQRLARQAAALRAERAAMLRDAGYTPDYLEPHYQCALCGDTGYADDQMCSCMKKRLLSLAYGQSRLADRLQTENFDYFDFRLYREDPDPGTGVSPRENMQQVFDRCVDFAESFPEPFSNLLLYGNTGLGKTFLCNCIAKEVLDKGYLVLYLTAPELCRLAEDARFRRKDFEGEDASDPLEDVLNVDLLIIDDLGTEFPTVFTSTALFEIINERLLTRRHTIISTNLDPRRLRDQYSDRVLSRLAGSYDFLAFFGQDIRLHAQ